MTRQPERPRWRPIPLLASWLASGIALMVAAGVLPGVSIDSFLGALVVAAIVAALNAVIPPVLAALRLPLTLLRSRCFGAWADGFPHVADIMVGSFYDSDGDEGCAFEELISFHGGIGGDQTRPFILHPTHLEVPAAPILGAATVHRILAGWRKALQAARDGQGETLAERHFTPSV